MTNTEFIYIFYFTLQIYRTVSKFIKNKYNRRGSRRKKPTAIGHGGRTSNRHGPNGRVQGVDLVAPNRLRPLWATTVGSFHRGG
jgi:hypothetical protein